MSPVFVEVPKSLSTVAVRSFSKIVILLAILLPLAWYDRESQKLSVRRVTIPIEKLGYIPSLYKQQFPVGMSLISRGDLLAEKEGVFALYKAEEELLYFAYPLGVRKVSIPSESLIQSIEFDPSGVFLYLFDYKNFKLRIRKISSNDSVLQTVAVIPVPPQTHVGGDSIEIVDTKLTDSTVLLCINREQLWNIPLEAPHQIEVLVSKIPFYSLAQSSSHVLQKVLIQKNQSNGSVFLLFSSASTQGEISIFLREYDFVSGIAGNIHSLGVAKGRLMGITQDKYVIWSRGEQEFLYYIFQSIVSPQVCITNRVSIHSNYQIAGVFTGMYSTTGVFLTPKSVELFAWNVRSY